MPTMNNELMYGVGTPMDDITTEILNVGYLVSTVEPELICASNIFLINDGHYLIVDL